MKNPLKPVVPRVVRPVKLTINTYIEGGVLAFFFLDKETNETYIWHTKSPNCPFVPINVGTEMEISFDFDRTRLSNVENCRYIMNVRKRGRV